MSIERWDPFREAVSLRDAVNSLLQDSFVRLGGVPAQSGVSTLPLDVGETESEFVIKAGLPGVKPDDVQITVHGDTLTIRGESKVEEEKKGEHWHFRERRSGVFQRSLTLSAPVDSDKAQANFEHGVLTLRLPKSESARPRQIKVGTGTQGPVGQK
jgi:HSP20 family protein